MRLNMGDLKTGEFFRFHQDDPFSRYVYTSNLLWEYVLYDHNLCVGMVRARNQNGIILARIWNRLNRPGISMVHDIWFIPQRHIEYIIPCKLCRDSFRLLDCDCWSISTSKTIHVN